MPPVPCSQHHELLAARVILHKKLVQWRLRGEDYESDRGRKMNYCMITSASLIYPRKTIHEFHGPSLTNASVNSSSAHALPSPGGNRGAFAHVVSPGMGHLQILSWPGGWALAYTRATPGHLTHVFSKDGRVYWEGRGLCESQSFPH